MSVFICVFVCGKGEVIFVFLFQEHGNLLRSKCENITETRAKSLITEMPMSQ